MTDAKNVQYWQSLRFRDADRMIAFLKAIGFTEHALYRGEDPATVVHAEYVWEGGGGLMFGTAGDDPGELAGHGACYLVTPDPDAIFERAVGAGATVLRPMVDQDYGGRGGTVRDPEGNQWSFGDYQPG